MKISARQYAQTLFDLVENVQQTDIPKIIEQFVREMKKNGHITRGAQIIEQFEMIYNEKNRIAKAKITTAFDVRAEQKAQIEAYIKRMHDSQKVDATYVTDATIKGGIIIRVGDEILDASVRKRINTLSQHLAYHS